MGNTTSLSRPKEKIELATYKDRCLHSLATSTGHSIASNAEMRSLSENSIVIRNMDGFHEEVIKSIHRWVARQSGSIDNSMAILYDLLKTEAETTVEMPSDLTKDEIELLKLTRTFDIETLNVNAELTADERELLLLTTGARVKLAAKPRGKAETTMSTAPDLSMDDATLFALTHTFEKAEYRIPTHTPKASASTAASERPFEAATGLSHRRTGGAATADTSIGMASSRR